MNAEFQITAGTHYQSLGILHEARGDQPGSLAALNSEIKKMKFNPIIYGSQKTHLNINPDEESVHYWANKNQQSVENTLSFYDGTKVQIETALIANGLDTDILQEGLLCPNHNSTIEGALALAEHPGRNNKILSDFVLNPNGSGEIFIVAEHHGPFSHDLSYFKMGQGPYYMIEKPYHLGYFETIQSLDELTSNTVQLFNNGHHSEISVAAVAKKDLTKGGLIKNSIGSFEFRGIALRSSEHPNHVPIGLLKDFELKRNIEAGETITFKDINLPETLASKAWKQIQKNHQTKKSIS
jgi:predicted homoserine dehydrogenase-like protein